MSRIIAGRAKGRRIETPKGDRTRPTTDRTREALFSMLASWFDTAEEPADAQLADIAVLDLYAGSGAVGLEAASRGASRVVAVEGDAPTTTLIRRNAEGTQLRLDVVSSRLPGGLAQLIGPFDLVFADPPYDIADDDVARLLEALVAGDLLAPSALAIVERSKRNAEPRWPAVFTDTWHRAYGETVLHLGRVD